MRARQRVYGRGGSAGGERRGGANLGCTFLLPFLQSETPPKGILQESFSFLSEMEDSFFIFLQFGPPPKGTGFLWFWRNQRIPSVPAINRPSRHKMWVSIVLIYLLYLRKTSRKKGHHNHGEADRRIPWHMAWFSRLKPNPRRPMFAMGCSRALSKDFI